MKEKAEEFFKNIDSEIQAYLLGFIYGDGSLSLGDEKRKRYNLRISVQEKDKYILDLFKEHVSQETTLKTTSNGIRTIRGKSFQCKHDTYTFSLDSKKICTDLYNLGVFPNKTYLELSIPNIPKNLIRHFIRGYFDADGVCITGAYNRKDRPTKRVKTTFCIVSKKSNLLFEIQKFLEEDLEITIPVYYEKPKDVFNLKSSCKEFLIKLYHYLYDDANFFFIRKKEKFKLVMLTPREFRELKSSEPRNA